MRRLFGCPDIVSLTEKFLMARNFFRIFTENNPVMGYSKTFFIPEAKGLKITNFKFSAQQKKKTKTKHDNLPFYEHLGKITYNNLKNQNRYLIINKFWITEKYRCLVCQGTNLCDVVMGNKQEPVKSLRFHHGARHGVNVQSEVRKVLAFTLYLLLNCVRWLQKPKDSLSRVGFITNWNLEMLPAMYSITQNVFTLVGNLYFNP